MQPRSMVSFCKKPLAKSVAIGLLALASTQAQAVKFDLGDFQVSFDSTFSYGEAYRIEDRNWSDLTGKSNNLKNNIDWVNNPPPGVDVWNMPGGYSTNGDLGNLNYDSGEAFSKMFKGNHELDITYSNDVGDFGVFVRGMYFYDFEMMDNDRSYTNPLTGKSTDPCDDDDAKDEICRDVRLLDAFAYADFYVGETPVSIRIGDQVISWGESTLIPHGISELNPVDIARLRAPGAELKEAFIPFGAVYAQVGITENFNVEAFYQYRWEKSILPAPGSYFATNDFAGSGGYANNVQLGFGSAPDLNLEQLLINLNAIGEQIRTTGLSPALIGQYAGTAGSVTLTPENEKGQIDPDDGGQYGLRLGYFFPDLNDTELGLYYMNYHSRRPVISGQTANFSAEAIGRDIARVAGTPGGITKDNVNDLEAFATAVFSYQEDIALYGLSFNTNIGLTSVAGEITYRQDEPLQIDDVELLFAAVADQTGQLPYPISQMDPVASGEFAKGFILSDTVQAQMTLTHLFGPTFGAGQLTGLIEVGGINIQDMPDEDVLRLNGPGGARSGSTDPLMALVQGGTETNPFPTEFAWGYRALVKLDYNDVFLGVNVKPRVIFSHDVKGITPDPLFMFVEDKKSVSVGVGFDYQSTWSADFSYNSFFDGVGTTNRFEDRDFVSFNIKYSI